MAQHSYLRRAARCSPTSPFLLILLIAVLVADRAHADVVGLFIYQVRVSDGVKWHKQTLDKNACKTCTKPEWKFLTATDWPSTVKVEVFWRWSGEHICNGCYREAYRDGTPVSKPPEPYPKLDTIDGFQGLAFTYENVSKNSAFKPSIKVDALSKFIVSPTHIPVTLKTVAVPKLPWVTILAPAEGQIFQAGPIPVLIEVKSNIPKKPSTVRLEVQRKKRGIWKWAAPGTPDLPWKDFPYSLPAPAVAGEYRIRVQGKTGTTYGIYTPWRNFVVQ